MEKKKRKLPEGMGKDRFDTWPKDKLREVSAKAGRNSGKAKRERKELKKVVQALLDSDFEYEGKVLSGAELMAIKQLQKAIEKSDTKAFEVLRDTAGQKPSEVVDVKVDNPYEKLTVEELKKLAK